MRGFILHKATKVAKGQKDYQLNELTLLNG